MSDEESPKKVELENPMAAWVKGGTTSLAWDNQIKKNEAEAEARRDQQDKDREVGNTPVDRGGASFNSHYFGHPKLDPKILVALVNSKKEVDQLMLCDIMESDNIDGEISFVFVCPDCIARGIPQGQAQLRVSSLNKRWFLDKKEAGKPIQWMDPFTHRPEYYVSAGQIMDTDILRCPMPGCTLAVRVHKNQMYRV